MKINLKVNSLNLYYSGSKRIWENVKEFVSSKSNLQSIDLTDYLIKLESVGFSMIIEELDKTFIVTDIVKSQPVFYRIDETGFKADFSARKLAVKNDTINVASVDEYSQCGFVLGEKTLFNKIFQVEAATLLIFDGINVNSTEYYKFLTGGSKIVDSKYLDSLYRRVIEKIIPEYSDKKIVIPLSGGSDSRNILKYASEFGSERILCYTFGCRNNPEVAISKEIANSVNIEWHFVEYNTKLSEKYRDEILSFVNHSANLCLMPHILEFIALRELINEGVIDKNCLLLPGHSGDFIAGSHIDESLINDSESQDYISKIIDKTFNIDKSRLNDKKFYNILEGWVSERDYCKNYSPSQIYELFDWKERQSKYIINSLFVYDYLGLDWEIPLWDKCLVDYWASIINSERCSRKAYYLYEAEFVNPYFNITTRSGSNKPNILIYLAKILVPDSYLTRVRAYINDYYGYRNIVGKYKYLFRCIRGKTHINSYVVDEVLRNIKNKK